MQKSPKAQRLHVLLIDKSLRLFEYLKNGPKDQMVKVLNRHAALIACRALMKSANF